MLGDEDVRLAGARRLLVVDVLAVQQDDHVGVLLDGTGFTQVRDHGPLVLALLGATVQLREGDDRDLEFLGQQLQRTGELGDFLLAGFDLLARAHELQVVEDDQLEVVLLLQPAALGADFHQRHVGAVVDEQRGVVHPAHGGGDLGPLLVLDGALAQVLQADGGLRGQQAHRDLVPAHFQGEHDGGEVVLDGGGAGEVQREGGLTDGGARGDDDHLAGVQAVGQFVEFVEAGGDARHALPAVAGRLDLVHGGFHDVLEDNVVLGGAALGHGVDLGLGLVDQVLHLAVLAVAELDDLGAGVDQAAQDGAFGHDFGVVAGVGGGGNGLDQLVEVGRAADPVDLARAWSVHRRR